MVKNPAGLKTDKDFKMNMMTAVEITEPGPPEMLRAVRRPRPVPAPDEVLIKVSYAGVNRPDLLQRKGNYPVPPDASDLPGLEVSGHIEAVGAAVTQWQSGMAVCALCHGGGYAEYVCVDARHLLPVPEGLSLAEAACLPETFITVWGNLFMRGRLKEKEAVLIHGGASGIGTAAVQLAREWGAQVFATAGSEDKCRFVEELGAETCFNYRDTDFASALRETTGNQGVDVILDMVGGGYLERHTDLLRPDGRLVIIAIQGGATDSLALGAVMRKRLTVTGSTLRPQSPAAKAEIISDMKAHVWPLLEAGRIRPVIQQIFQLADAAEAHSALEAGQHIGKFVLKVFDQTAPPS